MVKLKLPGQLNHCRLAGQKRIRSFLDDKAFTLQRLDLPAKNIVLLQKNNVRLDACFPVILAHIKSGAEAAEASADNHDFAAGTGHGWFTFNSPALARTTSLRTDI
ncbi:hypothetical protein D3C80_1746680 [compost metagenome]